MQAFSRQSFFGAALGSLIEYYDFVLFIIFLPVFSALFFPGNTPYQSLLKGYFILSLSAIARPLGGLFFGYLGDTRGRRTALLSSMYGIAIATIVIGLTPSYAMIGDWAVAIILMAKVVQVFCFGGEFNGGSLYTVEHAPRQREGWIGSLFSTTTLLGSLLASLMGVILTANFMPAWSWRLAFLFGGVMGLLAMHYRKKMLEVPYFKAANSEQTLTQLIKKFPREFVTSLLIGALITVPYITVAGFMLPMLVAQTVLSKQQFMWIQVLLNLIGILTVLSVGACVDAKTPLKIMRWSCWLFVLMTAPLLFLVDHGDFWLTIGSLCFLIIFNEMFLAPSQAYLKNLFSMPYRYRGISFSFCLGMSIFGSVTPLIDNYLYQWTGYYASAAIWLIAIAFATLVALTWVTKRSVIIAFPGKNFTNLEPSVKDAQ